MRMFIPRSGEGPVGLILPVDRFDGAHEALAVLVPNTEKRTMIARIQQVARHHSTSVAGTVFSDSHSMVVVEMPSDTEGFFESLGVPSRVIRRPENSIDTSDHTTIVRLFDRDAPRFGFDEDRITPKLVGQNLSGKDVYHRLLGRTFADASTVHAEWQLHQDGEVKRAGGRASLFLYGDSASDWQMIARTAVATASRFGRVSQDEIDELLAVGSAGYATAPTAGDFRELIEGEIATVITRGFVSGRDVAARLSTGFPPFAERDGIKLTRAQFSTPPAVGQIAAEFLQPAGKHVLEPTVGNGLLAAAVASAGGALTGFEIYGPRAERAASALGPRARILAKDFANGLIDEGDTKYDAALANPPFGKLPTNLKINLGYGSADFTVSTLDAEVAVKSIVRVKDGGNAVLVMPAEMFNPSKLDGVRLKQQVLFNRMFNEVHSVALDASLYKSMGANTPVLIHFLEGKREELLDLETAVKASANEVPVVGTFDQFYDWADANLPLASVKLDLATPQPAKPEQDEPAGDNAQGDKQAPRPATDTTSDRKPVTKAPSAPEHPEGGVKVLEPVGGPNEPDPASQAPVGVPESVIELTDWYDDDIEEDAFTRPYVPFSAVGQGTVVIQKTLQGPVYQALKSVQDEVGDLDDFVCEQLGVERSTLMSGGILSPEQVDSIALGLYRRSHGEAMIIGDKMGVGKGRQLAALALSALRNDQPVLFTTLDPTLFTDFASRDLRDVSGTPIDRWIANGEIRPFIFNPQSDAALKNPETGETIFHTGASERNLAKKSSRIDPNHNMVFLTYSQLQTQSGHWRLQAILNWLEDNKDKKPLVELDEVHKAAGVDSRTGVWVQAIIDRVEAVGGDVVYSSATSMKSGKNIVVYSAALPSTGISTADLMRLMEANPLSMQEVLSAEMASGGRLIEREMSSAGIEREMIQLADLNDEKMQYAREATDLAADYLAELVDIAPNLKDAAQAIARDRFGGEILNGQDKTVDVTTTSPVSQFDNYSRYLMLAVKGLFAEELMMKSIAKGEKPTLVVDSTADTLTDWLRGQSNSLENEVDGHPNLGHVLKRNASKLLDVRIETAMGDSETIRLVQFEGWYQDFCHRVDAFDWSRMRLNVLDHISEVCDENGLTFRDITKRSLSVVERDGKFFVERRETVTKAEAIREFGSGKTDVLGLNKGAATGLSAHASPSVGPDLRRRSMIPLQFQKDITDQRQVEGRINRFAQRSAPIYYTPSTGFAADERLANLFNRANRNLTSSTSASRENATNIDGIDLLNPVGDMAVAAFAKNNPEIAERMDLDPKGSDLGRKLLGRIVCLKLERQEAVLAEIDTIFSLYMEKLTREGRNPLRLSQFDWKAEVETVSVLVEGRKGATVLADQPVHLNRASYVEHVRWETTRDVLNRVVSNVERAGERADPEAFLRLDRLLQKEGSRLTFNFAHDVFKEARHGGAAAGAEFRNIDPLLMRHMFHAWQRSERVGSDNDRSRREIASDYFLDKMKFELDRSPDGETAKAWKHIRDIEAMSGRAFNPVRYMLPVSRATERAKLFNSMREVLKPGRVVGIRPEAIADFMQGEFGKALKAIGDTSGVIPAVITSVRFPKKEVGTPSDWHISFTAAGSQGYFGSSLSSMISGLDFSGSYKENDRPIVPIDNFVHWLGRSPKASEVLSKVYGEPWNDVVREIMEATQEIRTEGQKPDVSNALGYQLFSTINDHVPSGTRLRERYVLEGNLFAALQLVQSGKKAAGEKAVFTDASGLNRHAVVLSETNTDEILAKLASKSHNNAVIAPDLADIRKLKAYLEIIGVVHEFGGYYSLGEVRRDELIKIFTEAMYELDQGTWNKLSSAFEDDPKAIIHEVAQSLGNVSEDLPLSISIGGDPWRWFYDVDSRGGRKKNANTQNELYPAMTEIRRRVSYDDDTEPHGYVLSYNVVRSSLKLGLDGLSQTGVVAASVEATTMTLFFKKNNPVVKDDSLFKALVEDSSDHLDDMKLPRGVLAKTYHLDKQQDVMQLAEMLSSIAKLHQNEILLNGGGKRIYRGLRKLQDRPVAEQTAEFNAGKSNIIERERTYDSSPALQC